MTLPYVKIFRDAEAVDYLSGFDVDEIVLKLSKLGAIAGPPKAPPRQDVTWGPPKCIPPPAENLDKFDDDETEDKKTQ
jgi:hypothetical protein